MECFTCQSISGQKRISPGPTIHTAKFWLVEHAYPGKLKGWLFLALKRHVQALHELTRDEFLEKKKTLSCRMKSKPFART